MIVYLKAKRNTKTSEQGVFLDLGDNEFNALINVEGWSEILISKVYDITISGTWRNIPKVTGITEVTEGPEYELLTKVHGAKRVPRVREICEMMSDFICSTPDLDGEIREISTEQLLEGLRIYTGDAETANMLLQAPASSKYHDHQPGGLLRHIAKMTELMIRVYTHLEGCSPMNLMLGVLFHDLGKIWQYDLSSESGEYPSSEVASYKGYHIGLGLERWSQRGREVVNAFDHPELYQVIFDIIASHHGLVSYGYGSFQDPKTNDEWAIHCIDLLESRQDETYKLTSLTKGLNSIPEPDTGIELGLRLDEVIEFITTTDDESCGYNPRSLTRDNINWGLRDFSDVITPKSSEYAKIVSSLFTGEFRFSEYELHPLTMVLGAILVGGNFTSDADRLTRWSKSGREVCLKLGNSDMYDQVWNILMSSYTGEKDLYIRPQGHDGWTIYAITLMDKMGVLKGGSDVL